MYTDPAIRDVITDIHQRASVTPSLVAVRMDGQAITYRELDERVIDYRAVLERYGMSGGSPFAAALMHCVPNLNGNDPSCGRRISDAAAWLGRHLDPPAHGGLRVVS